MITAVRGFNDILPPESELWRHIEESAFEFFSRYGFTEIRVPIVEKTDLFGRSIGETTDIVEKEMYTFPDRRGDSMTLRPEGTAPVVRAYIEHKLYTTPVVKLSYSGPMFRYERPQKGRYRQFYQIGAEVLGDPSARSDAETIGMLVGYFGGLGLTGAALEINSLGCGECRPGYRESLLAFLKERAEGLCENCQRRIDANPLRALDCKSPRCKEATIDAPSVLDSLCAGCSEHFEEVKRALGLSSVAFGVNPRMVRGLDYYTRTTFEITSGELGSQNAIAAGGRYDGLVASLGGPDTPCFGFAIGVERLALLLRDGGFRAPPLDFFIAMGEEAERAGVQLVKGLREKGLRVVEDFSGGGMKKRMKRADRLGARYTIILGSDELAGGVVTLKDMAAGEQRSVAWDDLPGVLGG